MRRLYRAVVETLHEAAKHRGVDARRDGFTDLAGKPGGWMGELQVYERDGQACNRCRNVVTKIRFSRQARVRVPECQV